MAIRVVHLVRHGSFDASGDEDRGLTERGREQAVILGRRLAGLGPFPPSLLVQSTLRRSRETADLIAAALPDARRKTSGLLAEGLPHRPTEGHTPMPDATPEEWASEALRSARAFAAFFKRARTNRAEVLVSHGNWIRGLLVRALGVDPGLWTRFGIHHCSVSTVVVTPDGLFLARVNDTGHFPRELVTMK